MNNNCIVSSKSKSVTAFIIATISILLISNSISTSSYAQINSTNQTVASNASNTTKMGVTNTSTQSTSINNPVITSLDNGISEIKSGNDSGGKKYLYEAEVALEGNSNAVDAEKHIEASLKALKEGDTSGAISHAETAKQSLS